MVWAYHSSNDANAGLSKHTATGILSGSYNLIMMAMLAMQPSLTTMGMQPPSSIQPSTTMITPTSSMDSGGPTTAPPSYASLESPDGFFKLQWTYDNNKLIFIVSCKTTGWCAVGFTTADGRSMVNYDIAVVGVASGAGNVDVSQSTRLFTVFSFGSSK